MNQADLTDLLRRLAPTDWPRIWSAIYGHREACIAEVLAELDAVLDTPGSTRREIRERVRTKAQVVVAVRTRTTRPMLLISAAGGRPPHGSLRLFFFASGHRAGPRPWLLATASATVPLTTGL